MNECGMSIICSLFTSRDAYEKRQPVFFCSHKKWSHDLVIALELAILRPVLFSRNLESVDTGLLRFQEQI